MAGLANWFNRKNRLFMTPTVRELELEAFVRLVATPKRSDGTFNYCREALQEKAEELLIKTNPDVDSEGLPIRVDIL